MAMLLSPVTYVLCLSRLLFSVLHGYTSRFQPMAEEEVAL